MRIVGITADERTYHIGDEWDIRDSTESLVHLTITEFRELAKPYPCIRIVFDTGRWLDMCNIDHYSWEPE